MEAVKREKQRFQFTVLALVNLLVAILAIVISGQSPKLPSTVLVPEAAERQIASKIDDPALRQEAGFWVKRAHTAEAEWGRALFFQRLYAWGVALLLLFNSFAIFVFFVQLRRSQQREARAYVASTAATGSATPPELKSP